MSEKDIIDEILEDAAQGAAEDILNDQAVAGEDEMKEAVRKHLDEEKAAAQDIKDVASEQAAPEKEAEEAQAETSDSSTEEKKGFFKKKEKKDKKDEKIEELNDRLQRNLAEFQNFRNRTEKEKAAMFEVGARSVLEKILPVVDNFERGLAAVPEEDKEASFVTGMDMIYKQLLKTLEDMGVKEIEAAGVEFNPELHNAVMHIEDESLGENTVAEVFQKGYTYHDIVLRHAMVKVAN